MAALLLLLSLLSLLSHCSLILSLPEGRGSPDYGRGASPVAAYRKERNPDYGRRRSPSPYKKQRRGSPEYGRDLRDNNSPHRREIVERIPKYTRSPRNKRGNSPDNSPYEEESPENIPPYEKESPINVAGINIDCGSSRSYTDDNNVVWVGDEAYVTTGETMEMPNEVKPWNTLRYFPNGTVNCYNNIPVKKGEKTLVRTRYYYKNYTKLLPAYFAVVYDKAYLDFVIINETSVSVFSEVIFVPANEIISVCLLRLSPSHDPFISLIKVYSFDDGMYGDLGPNEALIYQARIAFGANTAISYPSDPYGRLWFPVRSKNNLNIKTSTPESVIDISGASNKPPMTVMSNALSADVLTLANLLTFSPRSQVYLALYFSEPEELTEKRSFNVSLDGKQVLTDPIVPVFKKTTQVVINASSVSELTFQRTEDSTLPPIINALELYVVIKAFNAETSEEFKDQYIDYKAEGRKDLYDDILEIGGKAVQDKLDPKTVRDALEFFNSQIKKPQIKKPPTDPGSGVNKNLALVSVPVSLALIWALVYFCKKGRNSKQESDTESTTSSAKLNA